MYVIPRLLCGANKTNITLHYVQVLFISKDNYDIHIFKILPYILKYIKFLNEKKFIGFKCIKYHSIPLITLFALYPNYFEPLISPKSSYLVTSIFNETLTLTVNGKVTCIYNQELKKTRQVQIKLLRLEFHTTIKFKKINDFQISSFTCTVRPSDVSNFKILNPRSLSLRF